MAHRGQRTASTNQIFSSTLWALGLQLRSSGMCLYSLSYDASLESPSFLYLLFSPDHLVKIIIIYTENSSLIQPFLKMFSYKKFHTLTATLVVCLLFY